LQQQQQQQQNNINGNADSYCILKEYLLITLGATVFCVADESAMFSL